MQFKSKNVADGTSANPRPGGHKGPIKISPICGIRAIITQNLKKCKKATLNLFYLAKRIEMNLGLSSPFLAFSAK